MAEITSQQFMQRILQLVDRFDSGLGSRREPVDWGGVAAARWVPEGEGGWLRPLATSQDMQLDDLLGIDRAIST